MRKLLKIKTRKGLLYGSLTVLAFLLVQCGLVLNGVDAPDHGEANQGVTFTMHCGIQPRITSGTYTTKLIIGFLAPKSWNAAQNTTVSFTSPIGQSPMSVIPPTELEPHTNLPWAQACMKKIGAGGNLVPDGMEWVVFQSRDAYTVSNNEDFNFDVVIKSKCGPDNMLFKLGFYYGVSHESLSGDANYTKAFFTDCFSVTGGTGNVVDYCHPQLSTVNPVSNTDNDIITLNFDNGLESTALSNTSDIYLRAKAFTDSGDSIEVSEQTDKTRLTAVGGEKYRIDLWPRGFFGVPASQTITRMEYYFTDATGALKVGNNNTSAPFPYIFGCN
jgi:hypothetical protein